MTATDEPMANMPEHKRGQRAAGCAALFVFLTGMAAACDFLDPTRVQNPRTTEGDLQAAAQPTAALVPGLRAQFARALGAVVTVTETVSDNYSVEGTGLNNAYDQADGIRPANLNDTGGTGIYFNLQELRALADFILEEIAPNDSTATPAQLAEAHYYRGMAYLLLAENFVAASIVPDAEPVPNVQLLERALEDLTAAVETAPDGDFVTAARAALARAHRLAGNADQAEAFATRVLASEPDFLFAQGFDVNSVDNVPHDFLVQRALQEMQPLPRLDFLDPKYLTEDAAIPVAKAEELHLILAEVAMSRGAWAEGGEHLARAIEVARERPAVEFADEDLRKNGDLTIRPRHGVIRVRADGDSPFRAGLVLDRPGTIQVRTVSGSSLDPDSVRAIPASGEESLLHALFLARQEILFLEGRRMSDLGIRLPVMLREVETNTSIQDGDPAAQVHVPAYLPPGNELDLYTPRSPYVAGTDVENPVLRDDPDVTIRVDMNRVLAVERASPLFP